MMRYFVDTNILLRIAYRQDPLHPLIEEVIESLNNQGDDVCTGSQNCIEFWNVCTRPSNRNGYGLLPEQADKLLFFIEESFTILPDHPDVYLTWREQVVQFNVSGVQVHDARLVATMRVYGITHILTINVADFTRYQSLGIVPVHPKDLFQTDVSV